MKKLSIETIKGKVQTLDTKQQKGVKGGTGRVTVTDDCDPVISSGGAFAQSAAAGIVSDNCSTDMP